MVSVLLWEEVDNTSFKCSVNDNCIVEKRSKSILFLEAMKFFLLYIESFYLWEGKTMPFLLTGGLL